MSWQSHICWPFALLLIVVVMSSTTQAQRIRGSAPRSEEAANRLRQWDRNRDGYLQATEIPSAERVQVDQLARRRGLDPAQPLSVNALISGKKQQPESDTPESDTPESLSSKKAKPNKANPNKAKPNKAKSNKARQDESAPAGATSQSTRVKGFGVFEQRPQVPGFGNEGGRALGAPVVSAEGGKNASSESANDRRLQRLAKSMMAQHDKNKNGKLEKDEWARLRGNPGGSDRNKDGVLTLDELTQHLAGYGSRRDGNKTARRTKRSTSEASRGGKTYRFVTPQSRLPKGLPGWFSDRDSDGDGQLSMLEYATSLSPAMLRKFANLDLNDDGFIVAKEYLAAAKAEPN